MLHLVRTGFSNLCVVCASLPAAAVPDNRALRSNFLHSSNPWFPAVVSCCCCVPPMQLEYHAHPLRQATVLPLLLQVCVRQHFLPGR
jgi:hypothetical protein